MKEKQVYKGNDASAYEQNHLEEIKRIYKDISKMETLTFEGFLNKQNALERIESTVPGDIVAEWQKESEKEHAKQTDVRISRREALVEDAAHNGDPIAC